MAFVRKGTFPNQDLAIKKEEVTRNHELILVRPNDSDCADISSQEIFLFMPSENGTQDSSPSYIKTALQFWRAVSIYFFAFSSVRRVVI